MRIEREPIEFDETNIVKSIIKDLALDVQMLSEMISDSVDYELTELQDFERDHVTDLLVEKVETLLLKFANELTREKIEENS